MLFTIGTLSSATMVAYGAYLTMVYALVPEPTITTAYEFAAEDLPEIGYYVRW